ncbi:MAG: hypothetical protein H7X77_10580 [Anaerolineae bacterium]|nr:hypothetical protein [Anaerolineae bacterium]
MRNLIQRSSLVLVLTATLALGVFALLPHSAPTAAQDDAPVVCDSTLVTLLLVAEYNYGYVSSMMSDEAAMAMMPQIELGQFSPFVTGMMMMEDAAMSEDDMMMMDAMNTEVDKLMAMDSAGIMANYAMMMGMEDETMMESMVTLEPGNVAGENEACTALRADVEKFILAHVVAEANMMMMSEDS